MEASTRALTGVDVRARPGRQICFQKGKGSGLSDVSLKTLLTLAAPSSLQLPVEVIFQHDEYGSIKQNFELVLAIVQRNTFVSLIHV